MIKPIDVLIHRLDIDSRNEEEMLYATATLINELQRHFTDLSSEFLFLPRIYGVFRQYGKRREGTRQGRLKGWGGVSVYTISSLDV